MLCCYAKASLCRSERSSGAILYTALHTYKGVYYYYGDPATATLLSLCLCPHDNLLPLEFLPRTHIGVARTGPSLGRLGGGRSGCTSVRGCAWVA